MNKNSKIMCLVITLYIYKIETLKRDIKKLDGFEMLTY